MKMVIKIIFVLGLVFGVSGFLFPDDSVRTVLTPVGQIIGKVYDVPINSTTTYRLQRFTGIPYAEAPTGNTRFKKPVAKAPFRTAYDARNWSFVCHQYVLPLINIPFPKSEDCLRLNVYVPGDDLNQPGGTLSKPVMIWIHGGGFTIGSANNFDPTVLSTFGDVIVVTINYRLAQFGFLSTGDSVVPGNAGLWDQHLAIQWVHDNIRAFGGDVTRVTLFGESAGSASVIFQTFYPGNKGLFQRAIAESGSITSPWASHTPEQNEEFSRNFSREAGCPQNSSSEYVQCLSAKPINVLEDLVAVYPYDNIPVPIFDGEFLLDTADNIVFGNTNASEAIDMFRSVDLIIGFNNADGLTDLYRWLAIINSTDADNLTIPRHIYEQIFVPVYVKSYFSAGDITPAASLEAVYAYTDWSNPDDNIKRLRNLIDLVTDTNFAMPTVNTANLHIVSTKRTYVYEFFAKPPFARLLPVPMFLDGPGVANHADDVEYVFGRLLRNLSENSALSKEFETTQAMMILWTNFAKSGNPNLPMDATRFTNTFWPSYADQEKYLEISLDMGQHSVKSRIRPASVNLWNVVLPAVMKQSGRTRPSTCSSNVKEEERTRLSTDFPENNNQQQ